MAQIRSIEAEIELPDVVVVPEGAESVTIDARVTLRNTGAEDVVVHAPSGDDRHFWHLFDANHREIQREKRTAPGKARAVTEEGVHSYHTETVAAGREVHVSRQLQLAAGKLRSGHVYTVRAELFGHVGESRFTVVAAPASRAPKRATGKRSADRKKAGKKTERKKGGKGGKKSERKKAGGRKSGRKGSRRK